MNKEQLEVLYLLAENERIVAKLYQTFAQKNEKRRTFWNNLADEELEHAYWIERLETEIKKGKVEIKKRRFSVKKIVNSISKINKISERASSDDAAFVDYSEQLKVAIKIEGGMLEKKFFKAFKTDDEKILRLLNGLKVATKRHHELMKKRWGKLNGRC